MCERTEVKYFPVRTTQTKLIRNLLYGFLVVFCPFLTGILTLDVAVYLTSLLLRFASRFHKLNVHLS